MNRARLLAALALLGHAVVACAPPGDVEIVLEAGEGVDAKDLTGLVVKVGAVEKQISFVPEVLTRIQDVDVGDADPVPTIVFACTLNAACNRAQASFVGCSSFAAGATSVTVVLETFDVDAPPSACDGFDLGLTRE